MYSSGGMPRRVVDYSGGAVKLLENRLWQRDRRDIPLIQPDATSYSQLVLPQGIIDTPVNAVTTKFVRAVSNKIRCPIFCTEWVPDGRRVVCGAHSGELTLWNGINLTFENALQAHDTPVRSMKWSHNGVWMVTTDDRGYVKYWQSNLNNVHSFQAHSDPIRSSSLSPMDSKLATSSTDGTIKVFDFIQCTEEHTLRGHGGDVMSVDWHPRKSLLASGSRDNQQPVKLWDPKSGESVSTIHAHKAAVMSVQWNRNGNWLLTGARDHLIKMYDIRTMKEVCTLKSHKKDVNVLSWHPVHESLFASGGSDGAILFWQVGNEREIGGMEAAHDSFVWSLAWHPLGHFLVSGSNDTTSKLWCRNRPGDEMKDSYNAQISALVTTETEEFSAVSGVFSQRATTDAIALPPPQMPASSFPTQPNSQSQFNTPHSSGGNHSSGLAILGADIIAETFKEKKPDPATMSEVPKPPMPNTPTQFRPRAPNFHEMDHVRPGFRSPQGASPFSWQRGDDQKRRMSEEGGYQPRMLPPRNPYVYHNPEARPYHEAQDMEPNRDPRMMSGDQRRHPNDWPEPGPPRGNQTWSPADRPPGGEHRPQRQGDPRLGRQDNFHPPGDHPPPGPDFNNRFPNQDHSFAPPPFGVRGPRPNFPHDEQFRPQFRAQRPPFRPRLPDPRREQPPRDPRFPPQGERPPGEIPPPHHREGDGPSPHQRGPPGDIPSPNQRGPPSRQGPPRDMGPPHQRHHGPPGEFHHGPPDIHGPPGEFHHGPPDLRGPPPDIHGPPDMRGPPPDIRGPPPGIRGPPDMRDNIHHGMYDRPQHPFDMPPHSRPGPPFQQRGPSDPRARDDNPRNDPRIDPRNDPRINPRNDPRSDPRSDPRNDPRSDPRSDPRMSSRGARQEPRDDPRVNRPDARGDPRAERRTESRSERRSVSRDDPRRDSRGGSRDPRRVDRRRDEPPAKRPRQE